MKRPKNAVIDILYPSASILITLLQAKKLIIFQNSLNSITYLLLLKRVSRTYLEPVLCVIAKPILTLGNEFFPI